MLGGGVEGAEEPGFGGDPVALDGSCRQAEDFGRLFDRQAAEVAQFDQTGLAGVLAVERVQGIVEVEEIHRFGGGGSGGVTHRLQGDGQGDVTLFGVAGADVIDQDAADHLGGDGQEMGAAFEVGLALVHELQIGFVDQGGWLQGMMARLAGHLAAGDAAHLVVDEREDTVEGFGLAVAPLIEESRDFSLFRHLLRCYRAMGRYTRVGELWPLTTRVVS